MLPSILIPGFHLSISQAKLCCQLHPVLKKRFAWDLGFEFKVFLSQFSDKCLHEIDLGSEYLNIGEKVSVVKIWSDAEMTHLYWKIFLPLKRCFQGLQLSIAVSAYILGTGHAAKSDEFSEKFQTAFDLASPPHFLKIISLFFFGKRPKKVLY